MAITAYADLLRYMVPDLPGYSLGTAMAALRAAGRVLCQRLEAWKADLDPIDIVADQLAYELTPPTAAEIKLPSEVHLLTAADVTAGNDGRLLHEWQDYNWAPPVTLSLVRRLKPSSAVTDGLVVEVVLFPTPDGTAPEAVIHRYSECLIAHALHQMLRRRDPNRAAYWLEQYNERLNEALVDRNDLEIGA